MKRLSALFLKGLIALLPLAVTILVLFWLGSIAEGSLGRGIRWVLPVGWYVPGMGLIAGLALTLLLGLLVSVWGAPQLIRMGEKLIARIPLVKTIYGSVKDLLRFFNKPGDLGTTSKVVVVSLGDTGIRLVGLLTREKFDDLPAGLGGKGDVAVYVPYSYQIGGFTIIVPRTQVEPVNMPLEDAFRFILTAGVKAESAAV